MEKNVCDKAYSQDNRFDGSITLLINLNTNKSCNKF